MDWQMISAVAEVFGAAGTVGALAYAARTYRINSFRTVRAQASQVHVTLTRSAATNEGQQSLDAAMTPQGQAGLEVEATAMNGSGMPVYDVWVFIVSPKSSGQVVDRIDSLNAGQELRVEGWLAWDPDGSVIEKDFPQAWARFRDADGYEWQRWENGRLAPPVDMRPRRGWLRFVTRVVPDQLLRTWWSREGRPPVRSD